MLSELQFKILKRISPGHQILDGESAYAGKSKLDVLLGKEFLARISGKTVVDFGCGEGDDSIEMARKGAGRVIGVDIRDDVLQTAARKAQEAGVGDKCVFTSATEELADMVVSIDAFEHFADPAAILRIMRGLLRPSGDVLISFGPTWFHPLGGHLFSVFPWAHLLFSEEALIRWRATFISDGATRFSEVAGGLNQMTIGKFEGLVKNSDFEVTMLETVPIKRLQRLHNRITREATTAIVRCCLKGV